MKTNKNLKEMLQMMEFVKHLEEENIKLDRKNEELEAKVRRLELENQELNGRLDAQFNGIVSLTVVALTMLTFVLLKYFNVI
jgi:hypothetical protein